MGDPLGCAYFMKSQNESILWTTSVVLVLTITYMVYQSGVSGETVRSASNEAIANGVADEFGHGIQAKFEHDSSAIRLHSANANRHFVGELLVGLARCKERKSFPFALGKRSIMT